MKLSICMMVKNEEPNLERCLESIQPLMNTIETELIIVDTGSTDKTVEIAKKYTEHVYYKEWFDDFSGMRNYTISFATGDWILILDADEEMLESEKLGELLPKIKNPDIKIVSMYVHSVISEEVDLIAPANSARIFRKGNIQYKGIVHNTPITSGDVYPSDIKLLHYGYLATDKDLIERKVNRTVTLLLKALETEPNNEYYHFQLSQSYVMGEDVENAYISAKKAYELLEGKYSKIYIYIYAQYIKTLKMKSLFDELIEIAEEVFKFEKNHLDIVFDYGMALLMTKQNEKAIEYLKHYLYIYDHSEEYDIFMDLSLTFGTINAGNRDQAFYGIATAYVDLNDYDASIAYFKQTAYSKNLDYFIFYFAEKTLESPWMAHYFFKLRYVIYNQLNGKEKRLIDNYIERAYTKKLKETFKNIKNLEEYLDSENFYDVVLKLRYLEDYEVEKSLVEKVFNMPDQEFRPYYSEILYAYSHNKIILGKLSQTKQIIFLNYLVETCDGSKAFVKQLIEEKYDYKEPFAKFFSDENFQLNPKVYAYALEYVLEKKQYNFYMCHLMQGDYFKNVLRELSVYLQSNNLAVVHLLNEFKLIDDSIEEIFIKNNLLSGFASVVITFDGHVILKDLFECIRDNYSIEAMIKYNLEYVADLKQNIADEDEKLKLYMLEYTTVETDIEKAKLLNKMTIACPKYSALFLIEMENIIALETERKIAKLNNYLNHLKENGAYEELAMNYAEMRKSNMFNRETLIIMAEGFQLVGDNEMADLILEESVDLFENEEDFKKKIEALIDRNAFDQIEGILFASELEDSKEIETSIEMVFSEKKDSVFVYQKRPSADYGILNDYRKALIEGNKVIALPKEFNLSNHPFYYGDVLYYYLSTDLMIYEELINSTSTETLLAIEDYLKEKYSNYSLLVDNYRFLKQFQLVEGYING